MPFHKFTWSGEDWKFDLTEEQPVELRQTDRETFAVLTSFCYLVPDNDPDAGKVYVVPGRDAPGPWDGTTRTTVGTHEVVIPPNPNCASTDLASVPWFMWWLVATYGNHTHAVLLHDALIVDEGEPPVERTAADRLLFTALREPEQRTGVFRHWLMWAAVSAFGTMGKLRGALFAAHVLLFWGVLVTALVAAWGSAIWSWAPRLVLDRLDLSAGWESFLNALAIAIVAFFAVGFLLWGLGGAWRLGVDNKGGWLLPIAAIAILIVSLLLLELPWDLELESSSVNLLLLGASVLLFTGLLWGRAVDDSLTWWLWPTALIGLPIALLPVGLIFASVYLVKFIDTGAARVRSFEKDDSGRRRGYQKPDIKPTHFPI